MPELFLEGPLLIALTASFVSEKVGAQPVLILQPLDNLLLQLVFLVVCGHLFEVLDVLGVEHICKHAYSTRVLLSAILAFTPRWWT